MSSEHCTTRGTGGIAIATVRTEVTAPRTKQYKKNPDQKELETHIGSGGVQVTCMVQPPKIDERALVACQSRFLIFHLVVSVGKGERFD